MQCYTARQKDYKRWGEMSVFDGVIKALLLEKKLVLGLSFEDPFQKAYWDQKKEVNGTEEFSYDNARLATFTLSYKFGNSNLRKKKEVRAMKKFKEPGRAKYLTEGENN